MTTATSATNLADEQLAALRDAARRTAGSLVDPRLMRAFESWWRIGLAEWASAVIGRDFPGVRALTWREMVLLNLAHAAEPTPPPSPKYAAQLAEFKQKQLADAEHHQAKVKAWESLRAKLPVPVSVAFNYSRHTYEFHCHGGDHIVVWAALDAGRLHRVAGQALCETPSNTRLLHLDNSRLEREAQESGREQRLPSCKACLKAAGRVVQAGAR